MFPSAKLLCLNAYETTTFTEIRIHIYFLLLLLFMKQKLHTSNKNYGIMFQYEIAIWKKCFQHCNLLLYIFLVTLLNVSFHVSLCLTICSLVKHKFICVKHTRIKRSYTKTINSDL